MSGVSEGGSFPPGSTPNLGSVSRGDARGVDAPTEILLEGVHFDGAAFLSQPAPSPKNKKLKNAAIKALNVALAVKDTSHFAIGLTTLLIEQARAIHEVSKAVFEPLQALDKIFLPLKFIGWANAPFVAFNLGNDTVDFFMTPGWRRILPAIKTVVDIAVVAEMAANAAFVLQHLGIAAAQNVHIWALPLGGAALGVQSLGLVINGWGFIEVTRSLKKLNQAFKEGLPKQNYEKAITFLTKQPETRAEKFREKFFSVLSSKQKIKIKSIYEKAEAGKLDKQAVEKTLRAVKHRFRLKQFSYALTITAAVTGMIAVVILLTAPTPVAPVAWFLISMSASMSLALVGISIYASKRLDKELSTIDPEPKLQPPLHRRLYRKVARKFKRKSNGSFEAVAIN